MIHRQFCKFHFFSILSLSLLVFLVDFSFAQNDKFVYLELAGSGGLASLNYEQQFYRQKQTSLTWSTGLSLAPVDRNNGVGIFFPLMLHIVYGKNAHKGEVALGQGITITTKGSFFTLAIVALGYRYQFENSKWFLRVSYTPLISYLLDFQWQHWGGLSVGYFLNKKQS